MKRLMNPLKNTTIKFKLKILIGLLFISFIVFAVMQYIYTQQSIMETAREKGTSITEMINGDISRWLSENSVIIKDLSILFSHHDFTTEKKLSIMKDFLEESNFFSSIYYGDNTNRMINASGWQPYEGFQLTTRPWYISAVENERLSYTNIFLNASRDDMIISISYPIKDSDVKAVISGDVSVKTLIRQISEIKPSKNGVVFLMDFNGHIIAHPDFTNFDSMDIDYKNPIYTQLFESIQNSPETFRQQKLGEQSGYLSFVRNDDLNLYLFSFIPNRDFRDLFTNAIAYTIIMLVLILLITLLFYRSLQSNVVGPIEELKARINELDFSDDFHQRLDYVYPSEFSSLVKTINSMLTQAEQTLIQKESAENELSALNEELISTNDILESKNQEAQNNLLLLSQEKELLQALFDNVLLGIQIFDCDGNLLLANSENTKITGYNEEAILNVVQWYKKLKASDEIIQYISQFFDSQTLQNQMIIDCKITTKKGTIRDVEFWSKILSDGRMVVTLNDITERLLGEEKLRISEQQANAANIAKSEFLANMSHELRTPLNGIIGFSEILFKTVLSEEQKSYLDFIRISGKNLLQIVSDILDFSKIEAGRLDMEHVYTDIDQVARHSLSMIEPLANEKGISLQYHIDETKNYPVYSDPLRLSQIINNLLGNAVKFTSEGSITLKIQLINQTHESIRCKFSVSDTGIGIKAEKLNEIFQSFTQADNSITREYGGTGLGLTISNLLLKHMNSTLIVESTPLVGSTFFFNISFDRFDLKTKDLAYDSHSEQSPEFVNGTKTFLIVDDDNINRQFLRITLNKLLEKPIVYFTSDAHEASEIFDAFYPHMVIVDLNKNPRESLNLIKQIRHKEEQSQSKATIIIVYEKDKHYESEEAPDKQLIDDYLIKPISSMQLMEILRKHMLRT